ncbi:hypothetical protein LEMLEM_LOCUS27745, partial [Lemmus lemmus]
MSGMGETQLKVDDMMGQGTGETQLKVDDTSGDRDWRVLSVVKRLLLFQKNQVLFPAPTSATHNCLELRLQGIFWPPCEPLHTQHTH